METPQASNISGRCEAFLSELARSIQLPGDDRDRVIGELRTDILESVGDRVGQGQGEDEALDLVIGEMGDPADLGKQISASYFPRHSRLMRALRYVAAAAVAAGGFAILWTIRAWTFGFSGFATLMGISFFLPVVLILWPGSIWKRNWLFALAPAGICLGAVVVLNLLGISSGSSTIEFGADGQPPSPVGVEEAGVPWWSVALGCLSLAGAVFVIGMLQRVRQRSAAIGLALLVAVSIELPFYLEEVEYQRDRDRLIEMAESGSVEGAAIANKPNVLLSPSPAGDSFHLFWSRRLSPGFAICYSSADRRQWIND